LFGLLPGLLSLLAPNKKPQRRRKTLIIATDYKIPKSDSQILLLLRFGEKEKIEFLIGMERGQGNGEGSKESCYKVIVGLYLLRIISFFLKNKCFKFYSTDIFKRP